MVERPIRPEASMLLTKHMEPLLVLTAQGLYCPEGDFFIDPWGKADKAIITHAHSDHARAGHRSYLCHADTAPLLKQRLGEHIQVETLQYGETVSVRGVQVSLHPAGHVIGSAQVRLSFRGQVWVVSGDYKVVDDGLTPAFEPVRCHVFVTESTFGLPVYRWAPQEILQQRLLAWIQEVHQQEQIPVLIGYSLGKAQRLLYLLKETGLHCWLHPSIYAIHETLITHHPELSQKFPPVHLFQPSGRRQELQNSVLLIPPAARESQWLHRLEPCSTAYCSGWMQIRGHARQRGADAAFALSDHADWPGLLAAVEATGAEEVWATHGYAHTLARYLREEKQIPARDLLSPFAEEMEE
ncbi:putative mRNA 3-end processing factor [Thermoflavifilum aggregans]|uniref:Putative mRNA 3-end processing factor n=2 Tax=Thermoflavifilum aggregans TaxID=454188 RepID=A0A2M9CTW5_9BACT|nr:putative mRNA 3-end processing factor [Thermoflavifilum aggregans]